MDRNLKKVGTINYKNGKYSNLFRVGSFILFVIIGVILIMLTNSVENNTVKGQWFLIGCFSYIILHESIHLFFMKLFSKEKLNFSVKFPTISVGSDAKFSKKQFMIIASAPVIVLGILLLLLTLFTSKEYTLHSSSFTNLIHFKRIYIFMEYSSNFKFCRFWWRLYASI